MTRTRQIVTVELGVLVILLAVTHHGPVTAVLVGAWLGFAIHSLLLYRRSLKLSEAAALRHPDE